LCLVPEVKESREEADVARRGQGVGAAELEALDGPEIMERR
jgi:hypothetical protein